MIIGIHYSKVIYHIDHIIKWYIAVVKLGGENMTVLQSLLIAVVCGISALDGYWIGEAKVR